MNDDQLLRYSRQIMLPYVGIEGQEKLLNARVLIIGMGGLGSPIAMYLASAGVGHLVICDFDEVDLSNLQRQIIHSSEQRIGQNKAESAKETLLQLNPHIQVTALSHKLDEPALLAQAQCADVVIDGTDNFDARFLLNQVCYQARTPLVSGAAIRMEGQVIVFANQGEGSCYRCLYKDDANDVATTCSENGVLSPVVGIIGSVQAVEAMKLIMSIGKPLVSRLLLLDAYTMDWRTLKLPADPQCPVCSNT
ncbi:HesA/MoeB/ThiF family protein [sulfur-oxidizing endosymbiont of Gigantopelta aegis]|uniref:HesA/MoeB/ThiF family protein n=1 Tax=sulfur-oxidizing endosymbiont of Gigantopelta aegis TaxID=2794934 RepID=UPI0018DD459A|nr:molybdopterin-synthase adenylyltransferase MoeB [sulfur-oxidizing endosymbiont of Gigantopelta aegis]